MSAAKTAADDPVLVTDLSHDGRGVCRVEGKTVFVHGALPGERVYLRYFKRRRRYDVAAAAGIEDASPDRVEPRCAHVDYCGGCALQHLDSQQQRAFKQQQLIETLRRIGGLEITPERLAAPLAAEPWGYRRKARLSVRHVHKKQRVLVGFRERNSRFVADCRYCHILHPAIGERLEQLGELIGAMSIRDHVPQLEAACGDGSAALVVRHLRPLSEADKTLWRRFHAASGIAIYLQPKGPDSMHLLAPGQHRLNYVIDDGRIRIEVEPPDFVQVNGALNRLMIRQALDWLQPRSGEQLLDLYCGLGNFSLPLARRAAHVTGIEGDAGMVARAGENAAANRLENTTFYPADLSVPPRDLPWQRRRYDAVLLDPPRSGAAACLAMIGGCGAGRVLYVSCQPATLARDLGVLVNEHGFRVERIGVIDMFPHTAHAEAMALLTRS